MAEIILKTEYPEKVHEIVSEALETEICRLEYSLSLIKKRLQKFEKKYQTTSENFIDNWTAEDLKGKDMEYIEWAGEHKLSVSLKDRLNTIKSIIHVPSNVY
jgi:hypothetical protein